MDYYTNLQKHLIARAVPWNVIRDRLDVDRTLPNKWSKGVLFPSRIASKKLIALFSEYGIELDYNDIYHVHGIDQAI